MGRSVAKSFEEIREARLAKMTPEARAHFEGYSAGFGAGMDTWYEELAQATLWHLLRLRRMARRLVKRG
jgi:hypothetical protein